MTNTPQSPDLLIIGGGVIGQWCAIKASELGLVTVLAEKGKIGQGASGGFLGALMPHQPINWNEKKEFQLQALLALETEVAHLENETGLSCGYKRCGRLLPIRNAEKHRQSLTHQSAAQENWPPQSPGGAQISWQVLEQLKHPNWLDPAQSRVACDYETLSARIDPRKYMAALKAYASEKAKILENCEISSLAEDASVHCADGTKLTPGHVIVSAGYESFPLLEPITKQTLGFGVKGQAVLLKPKHEISTDQPIIYAGGIYIIAHDNGLIAVGSTSETEFEHPTRTDDTAIETLVKRAQDLCPTLKDANIVERWAGVRPKAVGREPIVGTLPDAPNIVVCSGGFKITLGIAHKLADASLDFVSKKQPKLPEKFSVAHHIAASLTNSA